MTGEQEGVTVAWLECIGESDEAIAGDMLADCRHDTDADAPDHFIRRPSEAHADADYRRRCD
ncbi:MAG: hypothetical protein V5B34_09030 [Accumulibacter sp.]